MVQSIRVWNKRIKNIGNAKTKKMRNIIAQKQVTSKKNPTTAELTTTFDALSDALADALAKAKAQKQVVVRGGATTEEELRIIKDLLTIMPIHPELVTLVVDHKSTLLSCYADIKQIMTKYFKDNCTTPEETKPPRNKWFMLKCIPKLIERVIDDCNQKTENANFVYSIKLSTPIFEKIYKPNHDNNDNNDNNVPKVPKVPKDKLISIIKICIILNSIQIATSTEEVEVSTGEEEEEEEEVVPTGEEVVPTTELNTKNQVLCEVDPENKYQIVIPEVKVHGQVIIPAYLGKEIRQPTGST